MVLWGEISVGLQKLVCQEAIMKGILRQGHRLGLLLLFTLLIISSRHITSLSEPNLPDADFNGINIADLPLILR